MTARQVYIIGVAPQGAGSLSVGSLRRVRRAEMLFGGKRLLAMFPEATAEKIPIGSNLEAVASRIKSNIGLKRMVVLATGDPGFYGIARYLVEQLGRDAVEIVPNLSTVQLAFARIKESWDDAALVSVHSRPIGAVVDAVRTHSKVCLLTDNQNTPGAIARVLRESGVEDCRAYVCQDLGTDKEKIVRTRLHRLTGMTFSPLNVLVLIRDARQPAPAHYLLGIPEDRFKLRSAEKSLITKLEVRAVSLAKLRLAEDSTVWDIGAGSGAVSIEASLLARNGRIFAVEKNLEDIKVVKENVRRFRRDNVEVVHAIAPDDLAALPDPDAVFVGGSGGRMAGILGLACRRLKSGGRIVVNVATLENLRAAVKELRKDGFDTEVVLLNVARSQPVLDLNRLQALNPVFVITGWKRIEE